MAINAAMTYSNNRLNTSSPAELTLMLYEGAIKFCNLAILGIERNDIQKAHSNIIKVENIIKEFQITLDHKYAVAEDFDRVYNYIHEQLVLANVEKNAQILEEVLEHLRELRDTWKQVMVLANRK